MGGLVRKRLMKEGLKLGAQVVDPGFENNPEPPEDSEDGTTE
jgi:hypothetical protein